MGSNMTVKNEGSGNVLILFHIIPINRLIQMSPREVTDWWSIEENSLADYQAVYAQTSNI